MTFGTDWGWGADLGASRRILDRFVEVGGNFVDTASNYTDGSSEEIVGQLTAHDRDRFVIATKYTLSLDPSDPNAGGNHRKSLVRALEQSLRRLRTDYVDLLWLHMRDHLTPIEEAVRALDDQVRLGKVLHVGISDSPAWLVAQANTLAQLRGWSPFVALQLPYSAAGRSAERELLPMAAAFELAVVAWGVLEAGILTGKPDEERRWPEDRVSERSRRVLDALTAVAGPRLHARPGRHRLDAPAARAADRRPTRGGDARGADRGEPRRRRARAGRGRARRDRRRRPARARVPARLPRVRGRPQLIYGSTYDRILMRA